MKQIYAKNYRQIGLKTAYYRQQLGLSQEELAARIEQSVEFVVDLESPNIIKKISIDTLFALSDALGVSPDKFLRFDIE